jgi:hypothetical protein
VPDDDPVAGAGTLMRRHPWLLAVALATASVAAASCSGSPTASKHATTTAPATSSGSGNTGGGNTGGGNAGGSNTGSGGATTTTPGSTTTSGSGTTTTPPRSNATSGAGTTTTQPGSNAVTSTTSAFFINPKTGKVQRRVAGPEIVKFRPVSSPVGGTVLIVGKRLGHAVAVAFDGLRATITSNSATKIYAVVPAGATTGPISVVTSTGSVTVQGFAVT